MKKGGVKFGNRGLLILLGILCVVIIGMGIGIVMINVRREVMDDKDKTETETETIDITGGQTELDRSIANGYYPSDEKSEEAYVYNYNYLTSMIESGYTNDGQELDDSHIFFLRIVLARLMIRYKKINEAIKYLDTIEDENLSNQEKVSLYMAYTQAYMDLGDKESALLYTDLATEIEDRNDNMEDE